ncbi:MAG: RHS repeat-associated core domain-containing protein [Chloroflexaceae bacterium]|nr:RHS repeat-associated core domain-containing protein [bacterium]NJO07895.1 RHS repeat-associated core domain-containing protein [Chloroflexaceae bacterium]
MRLQDVAATGLYSLRARWYDGGTGRFLTRDTYPIDFQNPVELNRYGYTANNPVNWTDPSGEALVSYAKTHQQAQGQGKAHQDYINGRKGAKGVDAVALYEASVYSAVVNRLTVKLLYYVLAVRPWQSKDRGKHDETQHITFGLSTVLHLQTNWRTTGLTLNNFGWSRLGRFQNTSVAAIQAQALAYILSVRRPLEAVEVVDRQTARMFINRQRHAEEILMRWALRKWGGYPTPHRVLDVSSSRDACTPGRGRGPKACVFVIPRLKAQNPLLFEKTQFPFWPSGFPNPSGGPSW